MFPAYNFPTTGVSSCYSQNVPRRTLLHCSSQWHVFIPQNYTLCPSPRSSSIDNPLCTLYLRHATPANTQLALYADHTAILTQSWRTDTIVHRLTHATSVLLRYFTRWKTSSKYSQNRGHFIHSTPSCSPNTAPLPAHGNRVEYTSPIYWSPTRPQTPVYETFNLSNS